MVARKPQKTLFSVLIGELLYVLLFFFLLFAPAGTLNWWRAWVLLGVLTLLRIGGALSVYRINPTLLSERSKIPLQKGQPLADKILLPAFMASFAGLVAFNSLDRFRLHLLGTPSLFISIIGLVAFAAGWLLVTASLRTNAFATTVVRYQDERLHRVVDVGVYRFVRHPLYAGIIPILTGMSLWLESIASALLAIIPITILIVRIHFEERLLQQYMPEYQAYRAKVRSRLIPGLW